MTKQELLDMALEMVGDNVEKLTLETWLDVSLQSLINKKFWWWRKEHWDLTTVAATTEYNLLTTGTSPLGLAQHFQKMILLTRVDSSGNPVSPVKYRPLQEDVVSILANTEQGEPNSFIIVPGTSATLRFSKIPNAAYSMKGYSWATYRPASFSNTDEEVPLIPSEYHYVALWNYLRFLFLYVIGQKDERYPEIEKNYVNGLADLDEFRSPSDEDLPEMRTSDPTAFVQSTE